MTIDKIKHYLDYSLIEHINNLSKSGLEKMKANLLVDLEGSFLDENMRFLRNVELKYIDYKLS